MAHGIFSIVYVLLCDSCEHLALAIIVIIGTAGLRHTSLSLSLVFPVYPRQTWSKGFVAEVCVIMRSKHCGIHVMSSLVRRATSASSPSRSGTRESADCTEGCFRRSAW